MSDEKKVTGASYLYTFFQEVQQLTSLYSNYINFMLELEAKSKGEYSADDLQNIIKLSQNIRYYVNTSYIHHKTLSNVLKVENIPTIKKTYDLIMQKEAENINLIIVRSVLEEYVISLNEFLANNVIHSLLEDTEDIINQIYEN